MSDFRVISGYLQLSPAQVRGLTKFALLHYFCHEGLSLDSSSAGGIGTATTLRCLGCDGERNITDHDTW